MALANLDAKRCVQIGYDPADRCRPCEPTGLPPLSKKKGRKRVRTTRQLRRIPKPLLPCPHGTNCIKECRRVSLQERQKIRDRSVEIGASLEKGARHRKHEFAFKTMSTILHYPTNVRGHPDARNGRQKCAHCRFDASELWNPRENHTYRTCNRREEQRNGAKYTTKYYLPGGGGLVEVCSSLWRNTLDIGRKAQSRLKHHSKQYLELPPDAFSWGGSSHSEKERLVLEYVASVPRHFSHFTIGGTFEYVDCASSALQWWRGPTEPNDDGSMTPCFLQWVDERNGTNHQEFYLQHGWWPGVTVCSRNNKPQILCGTDALSIPVPAVSYQYFWTVLKRYMFNHVYYSYIIFLLLCTYDLLSLWSKVSVSFQR